LDTGEGSIPAELANGSIRVCHQADCDRSGAVDVADVQIVAGRWRCAAEEECYHARYDLDSDGMITVVDTMLVAAQWGWSCP
jgi:hypothetical protein